MLPHYQRAIACGCRLSRPADRVIRTYDLLFFVRE